jgi:hypothetical protein
VSRKTHGERPCRTAVGPYRRAGTRGVTASSKAQPWAVYLPPRCPAPNRGVNWYPTNAAFFGARLTRRIDQTNAAMCLTNAVFGS